MKNKQPEVKKYKAPLELDSKPVYILAESIEEARTILAKELIARKRNVGVEAAAFELQEVAYILKG
jgi:hypothetical protein